MGDRVSRRKGWRLPTIEELASLVDPKKVNPALPNGHPFEDAQSSNYWSSTTTASNTNFARGVNFFTSLVFSNDKSNGNFVWCVRGGQGHDAAVPAA